jgi:hypothetical protein
VPSAAPGDKPMFSMAVGRRIIHAIRSRRLSEKYVSVSVDAEMDYQSGRGGICEGTRKNPTSKILRLSPRPEPSPTIGTALNGNAAIDFCRTSDLGGTVTRAS